MGQRGFGQVEERAEVDGERPVPLLVGDVLELVVRHLLRCVADQDVDLAELGDGGTDDGPAVSRVGQVPGYEHRLTASLLDPAGGLVRVVVLVQVRDEVQPDTGTLVLWPPITRASC